MTTFLLCFYRECILFPGITRIYLKGFHFFSHPCIMNRVFFVNCKKMHECSPAGVALDNGSISVDFLHANRPFSNLKKIRR